MYDYKNLPNSFKVNELPPSLIVRGFSDQWGPSRQYNFAVCSKIWDGSWLSLQMLGPFLTKKIRIHFSRQNGARKYVRKDQENWCLIFDREIIQKLQKTTLIKKKLKKTKWKKTAITLNLIYKIVYNKTLFILCNIKITKRVLIIIRFNLLSMPSWHTFNNYMNYPQNLTWICYSFVLFQHGIKK